MSLFSDFFSSEEFCKKRFLHRNEKGCFQHGFARVYVAKTFAKVENASATYGTLT